MRETNEWQNVYWHVFSVVGTFMFRRQTRCRQTKAEKVAEIFDTCIRGDVKRRFVRRAAFYDFCCSFKHFSMSSFNHGPFVGLAAVSCSKTLLQWLFAPKGSHSQFQSLFCSKSIFQLLFSSKNLCFIIRALAFSPVLCASGY